MAHILRKYTSNRGSALFMVISTMTALIISCMAMYFTMISARASQYAVFSQMQATQTAQSVLKIARGSLNPYNKLNPEFKDKLLALEPGESITTDANGFMALDPNIETGATPAEIGAYSVTITCISKTGTVGNDLEMEFDYLVMSSFNGSRDAIHFIQKYSESYERDPSTGGDGSGGDAELFAATGYVPNDAYINGGYYLTDVFYDTQYTYMETYKGTGENRIAQNLYTGGDLLLGEGSMSVVKSHSSAAIKNDDVNKIGPVTWAIRGNFYPNFNSDFDMRGGSQVLVGGNFESKRGGDPCFVVNNERYDGDQELGDHISIYINGDLDLGSSSIKTNVWFFVNGKITGVTGLNDNSKLFATSRADTSGVSSGVHIDDWPDSGTFDDGLTYNQAINLLKDKTDTIAYYKWDLTKETNKPTTQHIDILLNDDDNPWTEKGLDANQSTFIISYDENTLSAPLLKQKDGNELGVIGNSFIIDSVETRTNDNTKFGQTILIDTGDDPTNIINIKVSDITGNDEFGWFASMEPDTEVWCPEHKVIPGGFKVQSQESNETMRKVLVVGRGTVLINVPEGITYTDAGNGLTGHIGWWLLMGGQITEKNGHIQFKGVSAQGQYSSKIGSYIHRACTLDDGCEYSYDKESEILCAKCGEKQSVVTCEVHGDVNKFCEDCFPETADRTDWCKNRVDNVKFEDFYEDLDTDEQEWVTGKDGDIVYPTTNFMVVSCDESAEMRFAVQKSGTTIDHNHFFGFIYAPYMTYLNAGGASGSHSVKLCGGMTVGDYHLEAIDEYIGCYPDHMPNELANMPGGGEMPGAALKGVTKTWKIDLGGYR